MLQPRDVWVLPEIAGKAQELTKVGRGLLSEAMHVGDKVGGTVTALVLGDGREDYSDLLRGLGVANAYIFEHPLLRSFSAETYSTVLLERISLERPWLFLMGDTAIGRELAPLLAVGLETGLISNCVKMDLRNPDKPRFFRPAYGGQLYQEISCQTDGTVLITMDTRALNEVFHSRRERTKISVIRPVLSHEPSGVEHVEYLPVDPQTADIEEANVIVSIGMGAATSDVLPLAHELAGLLRGTIGATRPVVDQRTLPTERMIGQTGKVVAPDFYLALGISGASHHVAGIQGSKTIISVNRDPRAAIFQQSDVGVVADVKDVLPGLIEKIRQARRDGKIL